MLLGENWLENGNCGHDIALLYHIAYYKQFDIKYIQNFDIAKTSISQTWHIPREIQLRGDKVDNIEVQGYDRSNPNRETKDIKSHFTILYQHLMTFFMYTDLLITKGFFLNFMTTMTLQTYQ